MVSNKIVLCLVILFNASLCRGASLVGNPLAHAYPCHNTSVVYESFESNQPPDDENKYILGIDTSLISGIPNLPAGSQFKLRFDSKVNLTLNNNFARIEEYNGLFIIRVHTSTEENLSLTVRGKQGSPVPNLLSAVVHDEELCPDGAKTGLWDQYIIGTRGSLSTINVPARRIKQCGRKQLEFNELITNAQGSKPGDWPWHAAIFRTKSAISAEQTYICGGTLISKSAVITAGHCVVEKGIKIIPERLFVVLGKYNIVGGDIASQEKGVYEIILYDDFSVQTLKNDIAILKLASEVGFGNYVQPICMWDRSKTDKKYIVGKHGTVVGWGMTETGVFSTELGQAIMPVASDYDCLRSYPSFFERFLNTKSYCAGFRNGTSVCNGDSGGGMYFPEETSDGAVIWSLRGLVSVSVSQRNIKMCDPTNYVVFTDIAKYLEWIDRKL